MTIMNNVFVWNTFQQFVYTDKSQHPLYAINFVMHEYIDSNVIQYLQYRLLLLRNNSQKSRLALLLPVMPAYDNLSPG